MIANRGGEKEKTLIYQGFQVKNLLNLLVTKMYFIKNINPYFG